MAEPVVEQCKCEQLGPFRSGVRGILARVTYNKRAKTYSIFRSKVERCDSCQRFAGDAEAGTYLEHTIKEANTNRISLADVERYRQRARVLYPSVAEFAIDDDAGISAGEDGGAWVSAWVWVPKVDDVAAG